ncbi:MAG: glycosyltransferase family 2 protein [Methanoregula sp.]|nr:glycosyltransferase family 2 protein [Methanoregula sp.]
MNERTDYSIVIPVFNSEKILPDLYRQLTEQAGKISQNYDIIFVDDGSIDGSWHVLQEFHRKDSHVKIIHLIKNFGQHNAILCGFKYSCGDYVITLDDDLQHPPEEIPRLIAKINEGFSVVYGRYEPKNPHGIGNALSRLFQKIVHRILQIPDSVFLSSFGIYKREVIRNMVAIKSSYPFLFGLMVRSTPIDKIGNTDIRHNARKDGRSNYGLIGYFKYSLTLIINYSSWPLSFVAIMGCIVSILSICYGGWIIMQRLLDPHYGIMGWNSLMVAITFLGGAQMMSIGIIGEYLRRILAETSYGQQYVIGEMEL